jgi:hypothetical protein
VVVAVTVVAITCSVRKRPRGQTSPQEAKVTPLTPFSRGISVRREGMNSPAPRLRAAKAPHQSGQSSDDARLLHARDPRPDSRKSPS